MVLQNPCSLTKTILILLFHPTVKMTLSLSRHQYFIPITLRSSSDILPCLDFNSCPDPKSQTFIDPKMQTYLISFYILCALRGVRVSVMVFNATFNNILVILWRSVLFVEEIRVPGENH